MISVILHFTHQTTQTSPPSGTGCAFSKRFYIVVIKRKLDTPSKGTSLSKRYSEA